MMTDWHYEDEVCARDCIGWGEDTRSGGREGKACVNLVDRDIVTANKYCRMPFRFWNECLCLAFPTVLEVPRVRRISYASTISQHCPSSGLFQPRKMHRRPRSFISREMQE